MLDASYTHDRFTVALSKQKILCLILWFIRIFHVRLAFILSFRIRKVNKSSSSAFPLLLWRFYAALCPEYKEAFKRRRHWWRMFFHLKNKEVYFKNNDSTFHSDRVTNLKFVSCRTYVLLPIDKDMRKCLNSENKRFIWMIMSEALGYHSLRYFIKFFTNRSKQMT